MGERRWASFGDLALVVILLAVAVWLTRDPVMIAMASAVVAVSALVPFLAGSLTQSLFRRAPLSWFAPRLLGVTLAVAVLLIGGERLQVGPSPTLSILVPVLVWGWACEAGAAAVLRRRESRRVALLNRDGTRVEV
ncbi:MAG: hypothetical protein U1E29_09695 [Coriobacteriia bacterium]|nr:hypothetical protein [Coriobacteriia bacterium]